MQDLFVPWLIIWEIGLKNVQFGEVLLGIIEFRWFEHTHFQLIWLVYTAISSK